ncbi:MAG: hypothetical protein EOO44_06975 [Flavobacterium sp.]|nr:MAG: hypothetical protein EOO44_06975 [Flavobacterium sp.]
MRKNYTKIVLIIVVQLLLISCQNTKQKIQKHVNLYNSSAAQLKGKDITGTTAKGFLSASKIEIRILTDLEQNEENKLSTTQRFPGILSEMIKNDQISRQLIEDGVAFDVYFLANNNTIFAQQYIDKEELAVLESTNTSQHGKETAKL